ncbi:hypothetical protein LZ31DRAFT_552038 [Colletotrichum somersetense]|nr:hypothetical protein LZ31DRAFT_552038 [Colletotrichum somersetense]
MLSIILRAAFFLGPFLPPRPSTTHIGRLSRGRALVETTPARVGRVLGRHDLSQPRRRGGVPRRVEPGEFATVVPVQLPDTQDGGENHMRGDFHCRSGWRSEDDDDGGGSGRPHCSELDAHFGMPFPATVTCCYVMWIDRRDDVAYRKAIGVVIDKCWRGYFPDQELCLG